MGLKAFQTIIHCPECHSKHMSIESQSVSCIHCKSIFHSIEGVLDLLPHPSLPTLNELKGMALENGFSEDQIKQYQVRKHLTYPGFEEKLLKTAQEHSHYYLQTQMHFEQVFSALEKRSYQRVLEIGSCHDYYFLKPFRELGAECFALNIHFDLLTSDDSNSWPHKVIGDMNDLPFQDATFDVVIISATSHHSTTPEKLISEIARVLTPGGQCLLINDPTWGIIKNFGGPDNTKAFRESHINENEYPIWRYNKAFKSAGLSFQHFFSAFYDQKLLNFPIHEKTRFAAIARLVKFFWGIPLIRMILKRYGLWPAQAIFGFPMNVLLTKTR